MTLTKETLTTAAPGKVKHMMLAVPRHVLAFELSPQ